MRKNNDDTTGNLSDYEYFSKDNKFKREYFSIDLSEQIELENPGLKQIDFIGKLEIDEGARMFFTIEKTEETILVFRKILLIPYRMETKMS